MLPKFLEKRRTYFLTTIALGILVIIGVSYGYFTRESLSGVPSNNTINVSTISQSSQSFITTYDNSSNELMTGILNFDSDPYQKISKFKVENIYDEEQEITINWAYVTSTLIQTDSAYHLYECDTLLAYNDATLNNVGNNCTLISPTTGNYLPNTGEGHKLQSANEIVMEANEIKYFVLTATIGISNEGRNFQGIVKVKDRYMHVLTINYNNGTNPTSMDMKAGDSVTLVSPTKTGYVFSSWTMTEGLDSTIVGLTITMGSEDTEIRAEWTPITYTVSYNCNGGTRTGSITSTTHSYDIPQNLAPNMCSRVTAGSGTAGSVYQFLGWAESSSALVQDYDNQESIVNFSTQNGDNITLYAIWINLFSYSNNSYIVLNDSSPSCANCYRIKFLLSGVITINSEISTLYIDLFIVGGGGAGGMDAGSGGGGGYTKTFRGKEITGGNHIITIGAGGTVPSSYSAGNEGGPTIAFLEKAPGGKGGGDGNSGGGAGGSGGGSGNRTGAGAPGGSNGSDGGDATYSGGDGQIVTTKEFGEETGDFYAGGGGGGGSNYGSGGVGGVGGGGRGGYYAGGAVAGTANTGGGGGGGEYASQHNSIRAGRGGSGIAIIRNPR